MFAVFFFIIFSHLLTVVLIHFSLLLLYYSNVSPSLVSLSLIVLHSCLFFLESVLLHLESVHYVAQQDCEHIGGHSVLTGCEFHRNSIKNPLKNNNAF